MLIKYLGSGPSPRSFIEPLQRSVTAGQTISVRDPLARNLIATGRWRAVKQKIRPLKQKTSANSQTTPLSTLPNTESKPIEETP